MLAEEIIIAPVVTEKSNDELQECRYTFKDDEHIVSICNSDGSRVHAIIVLKQRYSVKKFFGIEGTLQFTNNKFTDCEL